MSKNIGRTMVVMVDKVSLVYPGCETTDHMPLQEFLSYTKRDFPPGTVAFYNGQPILPEKKYLIVKGRIVFNTDD